MVRFPFLQGNWLPQKSPYGSAPKGSQLIMLVNMVRAHYAVETNCNYCTCCTQSISQNMTILRKVSLFITQDKYIQIYPMESYQGKIT